ncbi:uncharacterized protein [Aristolochia californica]|uniref:uncharacterized protein n=1 Tax=Aristolochia californica TaxID=171875 RepID=UPI0035E18E21
MTVSRSSNKGDLLCDPEIEKTLHRLRREAQRNSEENDLALDSPFDSEPDLEEEEVMDGNRTLKELVAPDLNQQSLCIMFPILDATTTFELKFGLIHLLPTFHGLASEDLHKHPKEFHVISEQLLIQYFYEGLQPTERNMIDAASGGALVDKTPEAARNLIANMAANSQQFGTRLDLPSYNVKEENISSLEHQIASLTSLVHQIVVGNTQITKACGICSVVGHPTDMCPTLQEEPTEQVNVADGFLGQPQRKYDPYLNMYNMRWRDHPNLSYGNPQETRASIQSLDNQMGQMATAISQLEAKSSEELPSQTVVNPRENASAIFLRSGKEVEIPVKATLAMLEQEKDKNVFVDRNVPNDDDVPKRNIKFEKVMIDLGASINVMLYSIYASLKLGPLNKIGVVIQLADRYNAYPKCVVEDVLVQAPTPDFKPLHSHLKYVFLGDGGTLPVIIFNKLSALQEEKHVQDELHLQETFPDEQ